MENAELIWWSIWFSYEDFGICCVFLKLFYIRKSVSAEDTGSVSPGFSTSDQLSMWGRIIQTKILIREFLS